MSPETTVTLSTLFSLIATIGVAFTIYVNVKNTRKTELDRRVADAEQFAKINVKLDQLFSQIADLTKKLDDSILTQQRFSTELAKQNEKLDTLFHYHDNHEERIKHLEDKE